MKREESEEALLWIDYYLRVKPRDGFCTHVHSTQFARYMFFKEAKGLEVEPQVTTVCSIHPLCVTPREKVGEPKALRAVGLA